MIALLGACQVKEPAAPAGGLLRYHVTAESAPDTRTALSSGEGYSYVCWKADDRISIFSQSTLNRQFRFLGEDGALDGEFEEVPGASGSADALPMSYALYPYSGDYAISSDGVASISWPAAQSYTAGNYDPSAAVMFARSADDDLTFLHAGGYFCISLYGQGVSVRRVTLSGQDGQPLAGSAQIWGETEGGEETVRLAFAEGASTTITLTASTPVALPADRERAVAFWFCVPPTAFDHGFIITVEDDGGRQAVFQSQNALVVNRASVRRMDPIRIVMDGTTPSKPGIYSAGGSSRVFDETLWQLSCYRADGRAWLRAVDLVGLKIIQIGPIPAEMKAGLFAQPVFEEFSFSAPDEKITRRLNVRMVSLTGTLVTLSDEDNNYYVMRF